MLFKTSRKDCERQWSMVTQRSNLLMCDLGFGQNVDSCELESTWTPGQELRYLPEICIWLSGALCSPCMDSGHNRTFLINCISSC